MDSVNSRNQSEVLHSQSKAKAKEDFKSFSHGLKYEGALPMRLCIQMERILESFAQVQPALKEKEQQIAELLQYNERLVELVERFRAHEKKLIDKCNGLAEIYLKSIRKLGESKNWDMESAYKKPVSIFESINLKEFSMSSKVVKMTQENNCLLMERLQGTIRKHLLRPLNKIDEEIQRQLSSSDSKQQSNSSDLQDLKDLKNQVDDYHSRLSRLNDSHYKSIEGQNQKQNPSLLDVKSATEMETILENTNCAAPNTNELFDLLDLKDDIETEFKSITRMPYEDEIKIDLRHEYMRLYSEVEKASALDLLAYLRRDHDIRVRMRNAKKKALKEYMEAYDRMEIMFTEIEEEKTSLANKLRTKEVEFTELRAQFSYLSMRQNHRKEVNNLNISQSVGEDFQSNRIRTMQAKLDETNREKEEACKERDEYKDRLNKLHYHMTQLGEAMGIKEEELRGKQTIDMFHILFKNRNQENEDEQEETRQEVISQCVEDQSYSKIQQEVLTLNQQMVQLKEQVSSLTQTTQRLTKRSQLLDACVEALPHVMNQFKSAEKIFEALSNPERVDQAQNKQAKELIGLLKGIAQEIDRLKKQLEVAIAAKAPTAEQKNSEKTSNMNSLEKLQLIFEEFKDNPGVIEVYELYGLYKQTMKCLEQEEAKNKDIQIRYQKFLEELSKGVKPVVPPTLDETWLLHKRIKELEEIVQEQRVQFEGAIATEIAASQSAVKQFLSMCRTQKSTL